MRPPVAARIATVALLVGASAHAADDAEVRRRADALIAQMTPEEKAGQITQYFYFPAPGMRDLPEAELRAGRVGSLLFVTDPKEINRLQRIAVEQTRLKIPLLFGFDVIHGFRTIFPVPIGLAASWDPAANSKRRYPWGDEWDPRRCNSVAADIHHTTPVGLFSPQGDSPCGAADMAGNVFEWTSSLDWNYPFHLGDGRDDLEQFGTRARRGGAFTSPELFMRTTTRQLNPPDGMFLADGFRCAVDADKVTR